jgi:Asp-tRNA(Asn)/Glu-tRNA(Gln) amidotransferase C subunit
VQDDLDRIDDLARLSGLQLDGEERREFARRLRQLESLIDDLPPESVGPESGLAPPLDLRDDDPAPPLPAERILSEAPEREGDWFVLPPVRADLP